MSQWGADMPSQPSATAPVTFFDPSKFQKSVATFPNIPTSQPQVNSAHTAENPDQVKNYHGNQGVNTEQVANQSSWNSWGAWDGSNPTNPYANTPENQGADVANQPATNDMSTFNQQWYGQNQWNQVPQQQDHQNQQNWDPNTQQWNPNQYNYQQGTDPNQYAGYNQYWAGADNGVNGHENANTSYQNTNIKSQNITGANYFTPEYNPLYAQSTTAPGGDAKVQDLGASVSSSESSESHIQGENSDGLDVSLSTESESLSQSVNQSMGPQEEGTMDGFFNNDDYGEENIQTDKQNYDQLVPTDLENVPTSENNASNNNTTVAASQPEPVKKFDSNEIDLTNQMQAVNLHGTEAMSHEYSNQGNNHPNIHIPLSTNQFNQSLNHHQPQLSAPLGVHHNEAVENTPFTPPEVESQAQQREVNTFQGSQNKQTTKQENKASPPFSDWEMVPPGGLGAPVHSRNASLDDNVHFFIGSTNSSTRVSPATSSKAGDDREAVNREASLQTTAAPSVLQASSESANIGTPPITYQGPPQVTSQRPSQGSPLVTSQGLPQVTSQGPLSVTSQGPPPPLILANAGGNPFRKSLKPETATSNNNESVLSSTHLDVTKPNYENSPVVLNQSISPIPQTLESRAQHERRDDSESPVIQMSNVPSAQDTPVSTGSRKSTTVPQSPIMHRKESPFQPPGAIIKPVLNKPVKASHDIPGVSSTVQKQSDMGKDGPYDRKERRAAERETDRSYGRRTPDWEAGVKRVGGRKTPDWDSSTGRRDGRRTPEWDGRRSDRDRGYGDRDRNRQGHERDMDDGEKVSTRPPVGPSTHSNRVPPSRTRQSAFHHIQTNRTKNNVSPATSLWETPDNLTTVSNILLVPATTGNNDSGRNDSSAPAVLTPVASLITSLSEQIKTDDSQDMVKGQGQFKGRGESGKDKTDSKDGYRDTREPNVRTGYRDRERDDLKGNRSYESIRDRDRGLKDSRNNSRERLSMYGSRNSIDQDDPRDRSRRGDSRERERGYRDRDDYYDKYRDRERDRPQSRAGSTLDGRRDRDYRKTDRYERPRSRQGERPASRQGESDRPKSRADYDKHEQYYRDRYRGGYDYDDYYRRGGGQYYDRQYYDYYYRQGHYGQQGGYYDEHGYYHHDPNTSRYQYDPYQRRSRAGTPGSLSDGGEEIFDYPPDLHDYSRTSGYDDYYSYYGYEQDGHRWDPDISAWVATTTDVEPQRQTPEKFMIPHMRACFGPSGQLVKVIPNRPADGQPATIEIHDVQELLEETEDAQILHEFPGPLVRGDTHKNDVLLFCQRKARSCVDDMDLEDRESAELIWKFLELLIKQNGTVVGTDIADLLLQGHEPTTLDYRRTGMKIAASVDNLDAEEDVDEPRVSRGTTPVDKSMFNKTKPLEEVTDRFRHLLLYGRKKDALDWAMKNNLWGHALFLASKMDSRAHANVMTRFANVAMRMNDPLQTLYQLMSGRQPAAVTCVTEEKWGDWRPHLAMVLSNHTQKPDLDRKCITTLGDTLASRGFLHASHFCYLMSQTSFGSYNKKSSKIVLIGSSHGLPLEFFATDEAIQCTEIYEYALALGNTMMNLVNFQYFKYLYATKLADYGYAQEALHYCEVISRNLNANPAYYQQILVKLVYDLSSQLKFADPSNLEENDDNVDPDWLRSLHTTLVQFEEGAIQPVSGTATPAYMAGTTASSESGEVGMYMQGNGNDNGGSYTQDSYMPNSGVMYSIQEQSVFQHHRNTDGQATYQQAAINQYSQGPEELQGQYKTGDGNQTQYTGEHVATAENQSAYQQGVDSYMQQAGHLQWPEQQTQPTNHDTANQMHAYDPANQQQQQTHLTNQSTMNYQGEQQATHNQQFGTNQMTEAWSHGHHQQQSGFPPDVNLGESQVSAESQQSAKRSSLASTSSFSQEGGEEDDDEIDAGGAHQQPSIFDLQPSQQRIVAPRLRKRTVSGSSNEGASGASHGSKPKQKSDNKDSLSQSKPKGSGGGLFAKIGGLFSRKNEMKLPDDKEPSIVWDPEKKRWVDKDGGQEDETPAAPPPKDADLSGSSSLAPTPAQSVPTFNSGASEPPPPTMGANRFSRRRGTGARNQYVDVMNPKPASSSANVPSTLFNTLPNSHSAPAIFNPTGSTDVSSSEPTSQSQRQETIPEEKNSLGADHSNIPPPATGGLHLPPLNDNLSRTSSMSSLSKEVQQILSKRTDQAPPGVPAATGVPTSMPTMFDPSQFQNNQLFNKPAPSAGHRLSNRRVYPK